MLVRPCKKRIYQAVKHARSKCHADKSYINELPIVKIAQRLLRESQWRAIETDKDGGCALIKHEDVQSIHSEIVSHGEYM
jgi:hypothetical protein